MNEKKILSLEHIGTSCLACVCDIKPHDIQRRPATGLKCQQNLKKEATKITEIVKLRVTLFDEMKLTPHFDYNKEKDIIRGVAHYRMEQQQKIKSMLIMS